MDVIDQKAIELVHELFDLALRPTVGRWLAYVEGHHFTQLREGDTTDMRLCQLLKAPFVGTSGIINLSFTRSGVTVPTCLWIHHGVGSGQTGYYPLARLEKVSAAWEGIDVFAMGHTTKMAVEFANKPRPRWGQGRQKEPDLTHRKVILIGSGGYSKTYQENVMQGQVPRGGYAEQRMLSPSILGSPILHLRPVHQAHRDWVDMTVEA